MAFCKECGAQLSEGAAFCKECGTKVNAANQNGNIPYNRMQYGAMPSNNQNNYQSKGNQSKEAVEKAKEKGKKILEATKEKGGKVFVKAKEIVKGLFEKSKTDKKVAIGLGAGGVAILAVAIGIVASLVMDKRISVDECIVVDIGGYDTLGYVETYYLDANIFMDKVLGTDRTTITQEEKNKVYALMDMVDLSIENSTGLSNGDQVVVNISYNNDIAHGYGVKLVGNTYSLKVSGLKELADYNPFDKLYVGFEGIAPDAYVYYEINDGMLDSYMFTADKSSGLSNGDVINITYTGTETDLENYGYKISKMSEQYTCQNLSSYLTKSAELTGEQFEKMKSDAKDCIETYFANNYQYINCSNLEYVGNYALMNKESWRGNTVYLIYSGSVSTKETYSYTNESQGIWEGNPVFSPQTVYFPIAFNNVIINTDKSITYQLKSSNIYGETDLKCGWSEVRGYNDGQKMFNDLILTQKVDYSYDVSESLTQFGGTSTDVELEAEMQMPANDYILPTSNSAYLTEADVQNLSKEEIRIATNELYARHGYIFESEDMKAYFEQKSWYQGSIASNAFDMGVFNEFEMANKDFLVKYAEEKGYR